MGMWRERIGIRNPEGERFEPPEAHHLDCFQDNEGFAGFEIAPMVPLPNGRKTVGVPALAPDSKVSTDHGAGGHRRLLLTRGSAGTESEKSAGRRRPATVLPLPAESAITVRKPTQRPTTNS